MLSTYNYYYYYFYFQINRECIRRFLNGLLQLSSYLNLHHTLHMLPSLTVCQVNGLSSAEQFQTFSLNCNLLKMSYTIHSPNLTGQSTFNCSLRDLIARLGGFGITKPVDESYRLFDNSIKFTKPLVDLIIKQSSSLPVESIDAQLLAKKTCSSTEKSASIYPI